MNIETKKTVITVNETVGTCSSEVLAETDIVLPESCPDILKVLQLDGRARITGKETAADKVLLKGEVEITLLYVPDQSASDLPVKSITAKAPFNDVCQITGITEDSFVRASADVVNLEFSLLNVRKLTVRTTVATDIAATKRRDIEFISEVEDAQTQETEKEVFREIANGSYVLTVADKLQLPVGKPPILEVVKLDADIGENTVKLISDKAVVKGTALISCLYISRRDASLECSEHEIPFTEILDLPSVTEDMEPTIDFKVTSIYYEADNDENGAGILGVELTVEADLSVSGTEKIPLLSDCYRTDCDTRLTKGCCHMERITSVARPQITVRGSAALPEGSPEISEVYRVFGKPYIENLYFENAVAVLEGTLDIYVLYMTGNPDLPLYSSKSEIPFTYSIDAGNENAAADYIIRVDSLNYTINTPTEIDIRANLAAVIKFISSEDFEVVESIEVLDTELPKRAPIVIYFVSEGDTLYHIAKKYRTTADKIANVNKLDKNSVIRPGMKLLIP
jgi:hypothetical protein